ncbi:hypothetical protein QUA74_25200 [Microcoleus sp. LAD1_D3]|uniref:hypothetical protein n=1 Tax=Microcoleus sp. LAD1_D3 TaxID=2819365 RepID=UPI002FD26984
MQNSQVFFFEFCKDCVEVRNDECFRDLRAIAPKAFLFFLFTYQGELGSFMQNSQVFFFEFGKHWVKVRNNGCFADLRAIDITHWWSETGFFAEYFVTNLYKSQKPGLCRF